MKRSILIVCAVLILFGLSSLSYATISQDTDITGTWLLYSGGNVAPDILQFYSDGTGITANLSDYTYYDETYISSNMLQDFQKVNWYISTDDSYKMVLSIAYAEKVKEYQLSFEYNIYPNHPFLLCLCTSDAGGGWIPVKADDLSNNPNAKHFPTAYANSMIPNIKIKDN